MTISGEKACIPVMLKTHATHVAHVLRSLLCFRSNAGSVFCGCTCVTRSISSFFVSRLMLSNSARFLLYQDVNGGWTEWTYAGPCCNGARLAIRECTNPRPSGNGSFCAGPDRLSFTCEPDECTNNGWGEWSDFGPCCNGQRRRTRPCLAVANQCEGSNFSLQSCTRESGTDCFTPNADSNTCDVQPFELVQLTDFETKESCCRRHFAASFDACMGVSVSVVDGGWGAWSEWELCCNGRQARFRLCNNPQPANGGAPCEGDLMESRACSDDVCVNQLPNSAIGSTRGLDMARALMILAAVCAYV